MKARGFDPLIDREEIYAFEDWWKRIENLIAKADTVVFILSPDAVGSEVALKEVAYAASLNKRFAPIVCRRVEDATVPETLRRLNFIFFGEAEGFDAGADRLAEALQTDIAWIRNHTEYGAAAHTWVTAGKPGGLLLRSPVLEDAERWIATRPRGAPPPTDETQTFITESRRGATRRRNILSSSLVAGLLVSLALAGLVYWQRGIAVQERDLAEHNAAEAKTEKERADESAALAEKNATEARAQRDIAEQETAKAQKEAALARARAELGQAQLIMRDAPREALSDALSAAEQLDTLGAEDEAVVGLRAVANAVREIPLRPPLGRYNLSDARVFLRQGTEGNSAAILVGGRPAKRPLTVVATYDVTSVIDDEGHAVGRPIASGDVDRSYANDAAWWDEDSFILATGAWDREDGPTAPFRLLNPALRRYRTDGTLLEEYLPVHTAPITSVAVLNSKKHQTIIAGDSFGNLLVKPPGGELQIIPTGVIAPVKKIIADSDSSNVLVLFGRANTAASGPKEASNVAATSSAQAAPDPSANVGPPADQPPVPDVQAAFNANDQLKKILTAIGMPVSVSYLGGNPSDDLGCAAAAYYYVYVCNRNTIDVWRFKPEGGLTDTPDSSFPAREATVTAIAASPVSPIIAAGYSDGQVRLWLTNRTALAELVKDEKAQRVADRDSAVLALGFIRDGTSILSSSANLLSLWDIKDASSDLKLAPNGPDDAAIRQWKDQNWAVFADPTQTVALSPDHMKERIGNDADARWTAHGRFLIKARSAKLRIIDVRGSTDQSVQLPGHHEVPTEWSVDSPQEDSIIARGAGSIFCALYGLHDKTFDDRQIYAIDDGSGKIITQWPLPKDLQSSTSLHLSVQQVGEQTKCWAGAGKYIAIFSANDLSVREAPVDSLSSQTSIYISDLVPIDNSDIFGIVVSSPGTSIIALGHLNITAGQTATDNAAAIPADITFTASKTLFAQVSAIALNVTRSLVAAALQNRSGEVTDVTLFDWKFRTVMNLPGADSSFNLFNFIQDGGIIRGLTWSGMKYQQDIELHSVMERAKERLDAWSNDDDRESLIKTVNGENDNNKAKLILREAVRKYPTDPQITLVLANKEFYTAASFEEKKRVYPIYDNAYALDSFDPIIYYMRGRARAALGDNKGAVDDFTAAIDLPHTLPRVKVIAGFLALNSGIAKLSEQLNLGAKAELYVRRAAAHTTLQEWLEVIKDIAWVRKAAKPTALAFEFEASAYDNIGDVVAAIQSYHDAVALLADTKAYSPFEELANYNSDQARRNYKIAFYYRRLADLNRRIGRKDEAAAASASSTEAVNAARSATDVPPSAQARLNQLDELSPGRRCEKETMLKAVDGDQAVPITFINGYNFPVRVYWLDYAGTRKLMANIDPGTANNVNTYLSHPFVIADPTDRCMAIYLAGQQAGRVVLQKVRLGVTMADFSAQGEAASRAGAQRGAVVRQLILDSPAEDAGFLPGDIIVRMNDTAIGSLKDALEAVRKSKPSLSVELMRDGREVDLVVNLAN